MPPTDGLILFAHGARDPRWSEPFEAVAALVRRQQPVREVRTAFLEFMAPTLPEAADALVAAGCRRIVVLPMFLGVGGHVRKDLPALLASIGEAHPQVEVRLAPAIGEHADVIATMARVAAGTAGGAP